MTFDWRHRVILSKFTLPDLGGKWFGTFGGSDELIDQAGMGFRVQESELSEVIE